MSVIIPVFEDFGQFQSSTVRGSGRPGDDDAGRFCLSIDTTAYNQLTREASWRWSEQERIGKQDLLQYTGKPGRTVRLEGESHAFFRKGWMLLTISSTRQTRISLSSWSAVKEMSRLVGGDRLLRYDQQIPAAAATETKLDDDAETLCR